MPSSPTQAVCAWASAHPILTALSTALVALILLSRIFHDRWVGAGPHCPGVAVVQGGYPLVGNLPLILSVSLRRRRMLDVVLDAQRSAGQGGQPFCMTFPALGGRLTCINNPDYVRHVQKENFANYPKGTDQARAMGDVLGEQGIFVTDGHPWLRQRKLASHIFSVGNFKTHVQSVLVGELRRLDELLCDADENPASTLALPDLMFRFTLSSFAKMAFNAELDDCLPWTLAGLARSNEFARNFDYAQSVMDHRFSAVLPKWTEWLTLEGYHMRRAIAALRRYCYSIVDARLALRAGGDQLSATDREGKDLLELFMDQGLGREELLPVILNFLIAGRDTTAQSLAWLFYELWKHPEHVHAIRAELAGVLGAPDEQRPMQYDDVKRMPYLQACFYEAVRLWPAVPKNLKHVVHDDVIRPAPADAETNKTQPGGAHPPLPPVQVRAGQSVMWSDWVMARMPEVWGHDCELFRPGRFLVESAGEEQDGEVAAGSAGKMRFKEYGQWQFHAFNGGPRFCLGKTLATYEGMAVAAAILGRYDVLYDDAELRARPPTYLESVTLPCTPYYVRFRSRARARAQSRA